MTDGAKRSAIALGVLLVAAAALVVSLALGGGSTPSQQDASATRGYLQARLVLEQALAVTQPATETAVKSLTANISADCRNVLTGTPTGLRGRATAGGLRPPSARDVFLAEVSRAVTVALLGPQSTARRRFVEAVRRLSWSDRRTTQLVHSLASIEVAGLGPGSPDPCRAMKAWVASGFRTLPRDFATAPIGEPIPARAVDTLRAMGFASNLPEQGVLHLLRAYEGKTERALSGRVERLQSETAAREQRVLGTGVKRVEDAVGLSHTRQAARTALE